MANSIDEELNRILQEELKKKELDRLSNGIVNAPPKSRMTAFVLSLLLGWLGAPYVEDSSNSPLNKLFK